jgi:hypothetical protein
MLSESFNRSIEKASREELEYIVKRLYSRVLEHHSDLPQEFSALIDYFELSPENSLFNDLEGTTHLGIDK